MTTGSATTGPDAHGQLDELREPTVARALADVATVRGVLFDEIVALDAESSATGAPALSVQRLLRRSLPDVAGLLAPNLAPLSHDAVATVLDELFTTEPFDDRRMRTWSPRLRAHLAAYATSLTRWSEWNPRIHDVAEFDDTLNPRRVTTWERPSDGAVAADFVGYVKDPVDLARPGREFATFLRDAQSVLNWLDGEHHGHFKGLRLWIVGADDQPVVRWLKPE